MNVGIPERIKGALQRYGQDHIRTGDFLYGFLTNNLYSTILRADDECKELLLNIYFYVSNNLPTECWGSQEKVEAWLRQKKV